MDIRNISAKENEMLELTDEELASAGGGRHQPSFSDNSNGAYSSVSNSFNPGTVTQIAYATSYVFSPSFSPLGQGSSNPGPALIGSAQASNYYNYSVGNLG